MSTGHTATPTTRAIALSFAFTGFVGALGGKGLDQGWRTLLEPRSWEGPLFAGAALFVGSYAIIAGVRRLVEQRPRNPTA